MEERVERKKIKYQRTPSKIFTAFEQALDDFLPEYLLENNNSDIFWEVICNLAKADIVCAPKLLPQRYNDPETVGFTLSSEAPESGKALLRFLGLSETLPASYIEPCILGRNELFDKLLKPFKDYIIQLSTSKDKAERDLLKLYQMKCRFFLEISTLSSIFNEVEQLKSKTLSDLPLASTKCY